MRRVRWSAIAVLLATGAFQCWRYRHVMYPDGSQYLDIARQFAEAGPSALLNGCWSPVYPLLVGLALRALHPTAYWMFPVVQAINFVQFVAAVFAFDFFATALLEMRRRMAAERGDAWLAEPAVLVSAYAAFAISIEYLINVRLTSPDMLAAAVIFAVSGLILKAETDGRSRAAAIGALFAVGYLAKTAMFLVALIYFGTRLLMLPQRARRAPILAALVFAAIASPWIATLSARAGRLTYGDTGPLMYAWWVNQWPGGVLWVGDPRESGTPAHSVARVFRAPDVFTFDWPTAVTYPPFYDPTYWNEGISARFYPARQIRAFERTAIESLDIVRGGFWALGPVLAGIVLIGRRWRTLGRRLWALRIVWIPAVLSCALFLVVHIEGRFIAGQLQVLITVLLALVSASAADAVKLQRIAAAGCVAAALATEGPVAAGAIRHTIRDIRSGEAADDVPEWRVAEALHAAGVERGARVGVIGNAIDVAWAQLAEVRIAGESPASQLRAYVSAPPAVRAAVLDVFRHSRVQAVVARSNDPVFAADGFTRLAQSEFSVWMVAP